MNWQEIFGTNWGNIAEVVLRGTITYLAIVAILPVARRESGTFSMADLVVLVVVADAAQNAMAGNYKSVTDGVVLVATIVGWSYLIDSLSFRSKKLRRLFTPASVVLVRNGVPLRQNMRQNLISMEELESQLRTNGLESISHVKQAVLEPDGVISVIPVGEGSSGQGRRNTRWGA